MHEIIIFILGMAAGFLGATVGGGGMIAVPGLIFLGFSPQSAVAISKVGDIGAFVSAAGKYWKSKKIDWRMAITLAVITIISSLIGTQIMVRLESDFLETLIGVVILVLLPIFLFGKDLGIRPTRPSKVKKGIGLVLFSIVAIQGAIVGAGGASIILLIMMYFFGYEIIRGYATTTPAHVISSLIPAIVYSFYGFVELWPAAIMFAGMLSGGLIGANIAITRGDHWIKKLFSLVITASVIKILFF